MSEPLTVENPKPGVRFSVARPCGEGVTPSGECLIVEGESRTILLAQFLRDFPKGTVGGDIDLKKPFSVQFDGYFKIPADGVYEFQIESTWDATVVLAGKKIIDDTGSAASKKRNALLPLKAGLHKISLRYNHRSGDPNFRFRFGLKGQGLNQAYGGEFVH